MKDSKPSLILFLVSAVMTIISRVLEHEMMTLIFKPIVVPAIFYYYLQTKTRRTNFWFAFALWLFFVGDMIMIIFPDYDIVYVMVCGLVSYFILTLFAVADKEKFKFTAFNVGFVLVLLALLGYILFTILHLNAQSIVNNYFIYLAYGIILILLVTVSTINYLTQSNQAFMYLCTMSLCFLVSDLFYAINMFMFGTKLPLIDHINLFAQFMAYFFMVKYFNARRRKISGAGVNGYELN